MAGPKDINKAFPSTRGAQWEWTNELRWNVTILSNGDKQVILQQRRITPAGNQGVREKWIDVPTVYDQR